MSRPLPPGGRDLMIIADPAVVRTLGHADRLRILKRLMGRAATGTLVAGELGLPVTRVHYHLQQLLKAGLIVEQVGDGARSGKERFYTAAARHFVIDPALGIDAEETARDLRASAEQAIFDWRRKEILNIDYAEIASLMVHDCLRVLPGEQVFVLYMPMGDDLAEAVVVELEALGARPRLKTWSLSSLLRTLDRHTAASLASLPFMPIEDVEELDAGIIISSAIPSGGSPTPEQLGKLPHRLKAMSAWYARLRERRVRYVELALPERGEFLEPDLDVCLERYWRFVTSDPRDLRHRARDLLERIGSTGVIRLRDDRGTDLTVTVDLTRPHISDGVVSGEDIAGGRVFDHLPAGALVLLPKGSSGGDEPGETAPGTGARGTWRADYAWLGGEHFRDAVFRIEDGRITSVTSAGSVEAGECAGQESLEELLHRSVGDATRVAFLALGVNGPAGPLSGKPGMDLCAEGVISLGVGNNEAYGGTVASTRDLIAPATGVRVEVGGVRLDLGITPR